MACRHRLATSYGGAQAGSVSPSAGSIRGLRITVVDVLEYLASGMTEAEILADFPDLTIDDILACLAFAADRERRLMTD